MNKEIKPTFNYILNDMALLSLLTKCLYSEYPSEQDKYDIEYQVKLLLNNEIKLKQQNNDLRKIYRNTYQKLFDKGNDELARYFQAQIDDCPTFYVEPIIDYYKEYNKQKEALDKIKEIIKENFDMEINDVFALDGIYEILEGIDEKSIK